MERCIVPETFSSHYNAFFAKTMGVAGVRQHGGRLPRLSSSVAGDLYPAKKMHLSANEGIEDVWFAVTGGQGFVRAALYLELLRRGTREVQSLDLHASSSWSQQHLDAGVRIIQGHVKEEQDYVIGRRKR
ncbi:unnamed protein product [Miscanthus lutarioriparius]|uniref:3-beta hydroxysteroid dehydrogenase/isomerase domain-containing protein n=1 Tax=Miscanthus lutarioriparius TaxID=422564 RepID=A0A811RTL6_9POAL|nr:unnamed protein product [Miscanthus lutarioriparius]